MPIEGIRAALLDIDGTLTDGMGGPALPSATQAVYALKAKMPVLFVTNGTSWPRATLTQALAREGMPVGEHDVITPTVLARRVLTERGDDRGVLIAEPGTLQDLAWFTVTGPDDAKSVLLATEAHDLPIRDLMPAVEALLHGAKLYTLQQNRLFRRHGQLLTDLGPVAAFLGYAANVGWENVGKPSPLLFQSLASDLGCSVGELAMIGDDAEFDAAGALRAGCGAGILVRTGKYRFKDEDRVTPPPTLVIDQVADLLAHLG